MDHDTNFHFFRTSKTYHPSPEHKEEQETLLLKCEESKGGQYPAKV